MIQYQYSDDLLHSALQPFNIIEEFSALSPKRKVLLCEHLFSVSHTAFNNTVRLLWPEAQTRDIEKLEKFLKLLRRSLPATP